VKLIELSESRISNQTSEYQISQKMHL